MSASERVPSGNPLQEKSGLRLVESLRCVAGSIAPNANSLGMAPVSGKAVVVSFMRWLLAGSGFLPVGRDRAVEKRQGLDAGFPCAQRRGKHAVHIEIRNAHLRAVQ